MNYFLAQQPRDPWQPYGPGHGKKPHPIPEPMTAFGLILCLLLVLVARWQRRGHRA